MPLLKIHRHALPAPEPVVPFHPFQTAPGPRTTRQAARSTTSSLTIQPMVPREPTGHPIAGLAQLRSPTRSGLQPTASSQIGRLRRGGLLLLLLASLATGAILLRPAPRGGGFRAPWDSLNRQLQAKAEGRPVALVDLDRLDQNLARLKRDLEGRQQLRVVVKSLPSLELLRYVLEGAQTRRLMVFQAAQVDLLLEGLGPDLDLLLGKPVPVEAVAACRHLEQPQWLVDSLPRLQAYGDLARSRGIRLKVSLELDIGLHRGGLSTPAELQALLDALARQHDTLELTGFMGYEGHVPHVPVLLGDRTAAVQEALARSLQHYQGFVDTLKRDPRFQATLPTLIFNSGGSRTFSLYRGVTTPVNELAVGSILLKPEGFDDPWLEGYLPALTLATPILKRLTGPLLPFLEPVWPLIRRWDANKAVGFYVYGGWCGEAVAPEGLERGWYNGDDNRNLQPNQGFWMGSNAVSAQVGDYAFFRPCEGDALIAFQHLYTVRGGQLAERWAPLPFLN